MNYAEQIEQVRKTLGSDLTILGHHYQGDEVIRHVDVAGDSLELARLVPDSKAKYIVFCGVFFMAESAAILSRSGQEVFTPALDARCIMSNMAPAALVETVLKKIMETGRKITPLTYVNSSAAVKAICGRHGGAVCTSANAKTMLKWALDQGDAAFFLPDKNLALNTGDLLGIPEDERMVLDIRQDGACVDMEKAASSRLIAWPGCCAIHNRFTLEQITAAREKFPNGRVLLHPECKQKEIQAADGNGSTSYLIKEVAEAPDGAELIIGTEINLVARLAHQYKGKKTIVPLAHSACSHMAKGTAEKLANLLNAILKHHSGEKPIAPVQVPESIAAPSLKALERMLKACS